MEKQLVHADMDSLISNINQWLQSLLTSWGIPEDWVNYTTLIVLLIIVIAIVYVLQFVTKWILNFVLKRAFKITKINFFKFAISNRLPHFLALVVPYSFVRGAIPIVFYDFPAFINPLIKLTDIYMVFMIIWTIMSIIRSFGDVIQLKPAFHNKPLKSYLQVIQIIFIIFGAVAVFCILTGKSVGTFFAAMGAASAVLMLMFKDTIMGFVGSIQISTNDMVRLGDWITMNKYGADGTVEEINLTTVKVRNFDKTITTIPTYALISDSFQNWRGMQESGGRRFRRAFNIKFDSIRFLTNDELEHFKKVDAGLAEFINQKQAIYSEIDKGVKVDESLPISGHRLTNNDLFIQYAFNYLKTHPNINPDMTLLVRLLSPGTQGLPIELYAFTNTTVWANYEGIMTEIMNHLISQISNFGLIIYQESAGSDGYNVYMMKDNRIES